MQLEISQVHYFVESKSSCYGKKVFIRIILTFSNKHILPLTYQMFTMSAMKTRFIVATPD